MEKNNKEIQIQKLQDQIWWTRISRIKAETRLINKESFIQFVNIYYSIIAIICSVISFAYNDQAMSLFTIIITIGLLVSILYLNAQKYLEQATDYRKNYTELHKLEMSLNEEDADFKEIRMKYCDLMNSASNHIEYDYLRAIEDSKPEYRMNCNWETKRIRLLYERGKRAVVKFTVVALPFVILWICEKLVV